MIVGYCSIFAFEPAARLSTQERELARFGAEKVYCERLGGFGKLKELESAIDAARKGDLLIVTRPYRIASSTRDVVNLIERLNRKGVGLRILDTPIDTSTTTGRMILGSAPLWSLGISPLRAMLWDAFVGWWWPAQKQRVARPT